MISESKARSGLRTIGAKIRQAGLCPDPPGAKPLDLKYMKINGFPKAGGRRAKARSGLWWVSALRLCAATAKPWPWLSLSVNHKRGWYYFQCNEVQGLGPWRGAGQRPALASVCRRLQSWYNPPQMNRGTPADAPVQFSRSTKRQAGSKHGTLLASVCTQASFTLAPIFMVSGSILMRLVIIVGPSFSVTYAMVKLDRSMVEKL